MQDDPVSWQLDRYCLIENLVAQRQLKKISQKELAIRMHISRDTLVSLEQHESDPRLSIMQRYAHALGGRVEFQFIKVIGNGE